MKYITQSRPSTPFVALMRFDIDRSSHRGAAAGGRRAPRLMDRTLFHNALFKRVARQNATADLYPARDRSGRPNGKRGPPGPPFWVIAFATRAVRP
jgi:hypothetical protein